MTEELSLINKNFESQDDALSLAGGDHSVYFSKLHKYGNVFEDS